MTTERTRALAIRYMDLLDRHDLDGMLALCHPDCRFHGFAPQPLDRAGFARAMTGYLQAFPDACFPVDALLVEGDAAANRHRMEATHTGTFQGIPATGRHVSVAGMDIVRVDGGVITEFWLVADLLGLLQQIGAISAPQAA